MTISASLAREEAVRLLTDFVPRAGRAYAAQRNFDRGPLDRGNVSMLSPYVRHRVVTETEVLTAILAQHTASAAFKSVQEVMWRTYWKGWLEAHPSAWSDYLADLDIALRDLEGSPSAYDRHERATRGETGIAAFDAWAHELIEHGYLHNHARMWFASVWIFTLELPWELGADFFMRHLLDGDPASNTLSWRWVAGLQTPGKTYLARRSNILHYTEGRLDPGADLARVARAERGTARLPLEPLSLPAERNVADPALLVLHDDDVGIATLPLESGAVRGVVGLSLAALRSPAGVAPNVAAFVRTVVREAVRSTIAARALEPSDEDVRDVEDVAETARVVAGVAVARGLECVVTPYGNVGPGRAMVDALRAACAASGLAFEVLVRRYDAVTWPHATRGFFQFGKRIPQSLAELGISPTGQDVREA